MSLLIPKPDRICRDTSFALVNAHDIAWRVTKDEYVRTSGITGVLVNDRVGPLPHATPDRRGRYDTLGRTVYFADSAKTALAEVLQVFRSDVMAMTRDAAAIGMDVDEYRHRLAKEAAERNLPGPGQIPVEWHMTRSLFKVQLPQHGWWVQIDDPATLAALSDRLVGAVDQLDLGDVCGNDRGLTTELAQVIRDSVLDDGSLPLGIIFPSKTAYGRCCAWWNRRADDNLNPGSNDPKLIDSLNVGVPELGLVCHDWGLEQIGSA